MANMYVYRDSVSGSIGEIFQLPNDATMRRACIRSLASVPPEVAKDTVVLCVGTIDTDIDNNPIVQPCIPRVALSGDTPEVAEFRRLMMSEAIAHSEEV